MLRCFHWAIFRTSCQENEVIFLPFLRNFQVLHIVTWILIPLKCLRGRLMTANQRLERTWFFSCYASTCEIGQRRTINGSKGQIDSGYFLSNSLRIPLIMEWFPRCFDSVKEGCPLWRINARKTGFAYAARLFLSHGQQQDSGSTSPGAIADASKDVNYRQKHIRKYLFIN